MTTRARWMAVALAGALALAGCAGGTEAGSGATTSASAACRATMDRMLLGASGGTLAAALGRAAILARDCGAPGI